MAVKPPAPEAGVGAVDRALAILLAYRPGDAALSLAELARRTGLYKSTLLRLMASLERAGMLLRPGAAAEWRLGPALVGLGQRAAAPDALLEAQLLPLLQRLAAETGESASFYIRQGGQRLCRFRVEGRHAVRDQLPPGSLLPLDRGAAGHVLRGAGPTATIGERDPELAAVAAPVFSGSGALLGALCLSGTATRFAKAGRAAALQQVTVAAAAGLRGF